MCGRYEVTREFSELKLAFGARAENPGDELDFDQNISPSYGPGARAPLVIGAEGDKRIVGPRFWFIPRLWQGSLRNLPTSFNARADRLHSRFWREAFGQNRCLVPALRWFERDAHKRDYEFCPAEPALRAHGSALFAFAGLWSSRQDEEDRQSKSFAIITTDAAGAGRDVHARTPLLVHPAFYDRWLFGSDEDRALQEIVEVAGGVPLSIARRAPSKTTHVSPHPQSSSQLELFELTRKR